MNSSDSRPTKDTKRPRTDGADDRTRTAVQQACDDQLANEFRDRYLRAVSGRTDGLAIAFASDEKDGCPKRTVSPRTDDASDGKDGSPRSLASAAPQSSKPTYLVTSVPFPTSEMEQWSRRIPTTISLREHLGNQK